MTPSEFLALIVPAAIASEKITGISAAFVVAQGALESAWGSSKLVARANNIFGVKADISWTGRSIPMLTTEYIKGFPVTVTATWRKYDTWQDCIDDHAKFFAVNKRYTDAMRVKGNALAFADAIVKAGYCTDPNYTIKVFAVIKAHDLINVCSSKPVVN